jgi:alkylhydroperoxidase family enzyme
MARLPYVDPESAPESVREAFAGLPVHLNIFKIMAHAGTCFRPLLRLGSAILGHQQLDAKLRELAILRIAKLSNAEYEWSQHVPLAKAAGASDAQIQALERSAVDADCFDPTERLVLRFTSELVEGVKASEATFTEMRSRFSAQEIVELIVAIGFYMMMARLMESTETDPDSPAGTALLDAID